MESDDEVWTASDAELDSEAEELEPEVDSWMQRLQKEGKDGRSLVPEVTPRMAMESFRKSIMQSGDAVDLDAILGELYELESQLSHQQSEIGCEDHTNLSARLLTSGQKELQTTNALHIVDVSSLPTVTTTSTDDDFSATPIFRDYQSSPARSLNSAPKNQRVRHDSDPNVLESQLESALSELTCFLHPEMDFGRSQLESPDSSASGSIIYSPESTFRSVGGVTLVAADVHPPHRVTFAPPQTIPHVRFQDEVEPRPNPSTAPTPSSLPVHETALSDSDSLRMHTAPGGTSPSPVRHSGSDGSDAGDSAFSDSGSLPSSGSHISVTSSSGSSGTGNTTTKDQPEKSKQEKIKIALEKIKEANIKKLFLRAYMTDGTSKSILVDETLTVAMVTEMLVKKNHVKEKLEWSLVERLPSLHMERLLEDHESLVMCLIDWSRDTDNRLYFVERPEKFALVEAPELLLGDAQCDPKSREALREEYLIRGATPPTQGVLYLKSDGRKSWKKFHFSLRASGLYYTAKGKGKTTKDLICLQQLESVQVFTGIGWRKKFKAPSDYGFALKPQQIQKKNSKWVKYLAVEDEIDLQRWVACIRAVKHGRQLCDNLAKARLRLSQWDRLEISTNQALLSPQMNPRASMRLRKEIEKKARLSDSCSGGGSVMSHSGSNEDNVDAMDCPTPDNASMNGSLDRGSLHGTNTDGSEDGGTLTSRSGGSKKGKTNCDCDTDEGVAHVTVHQQHTVQGTYRNYSGNGHVEMTFSPSETKEPSQTRSGENGRITMSSFRMPSDGVAADDTFRRHCKEGNSLDESRKQMSFVRNGGSRVSSMSLPASGGGGGDHAVSVLPSQTRTSNAHGDFDRVDRNSGTLLLPTQQTVSSSTPGSPMHGSITPKSHRRSDSSGSSNILRAKPPPPPRSDHTRLSAGKDELSSKLLLGDLKTRLALRGGETGEQLPPPPADMLVGLEPDGRSRSVQLTPLDMHDSNSSVVRSPPSPTAVKVLPSLPASSTRLSCNGQSPSAPPSPRKLPPPPLAKKPRAVVPP